ncbi:MAG: hypothetical protein RIT28_27 [Pseudomonadota bacterium]
MRLIRAARLGNAESFGALWDAEVDRLFSVACVLVAETDALSLVGEAFGRLSARLGQLSLQQPFGEQAAAALLTVTLHRLRPPRLQSILPAPGPLTRGGVPPGAPRSGGDPAARVEAVVRGANVPLRLIWAFSTLGGLKARHLATLTGEPEALVREARTLMQYRVMAAMQGDL